LLPADLVTRSIANSPLSHKTQTQAQAQAYGHGHTDTGTNTDTAVSDFALVRAFYILASLHLFTE